MSQPLTRSRRASAALVLMLCAVLVLAAAAPASATSRTRASKKALAALGSAHGTGAVVVFGLMKPLRAGTRVTQARASKASKGGSKVAKVGAEPAFFYYEDLGPSQPYAHPGRVALVGARTGKVRISRTIRHAPLVNGKLPAFLRSSKAYRSAKYRIFAREAAPSGTGDSTTGAGPVLTGPIVQEGSPILGNESGSHPNSPPKA